VLGGSQFATDREGLMLDVPKKKYADLRGDALALVDYMIGKLLEIMEQEPELARDILPVAIEERRPAIISLMDLGILKLRTDMGIEHIWWTIHLLGEYLPIGGQHLPPERN
jgi:hypothetical protein